MVFTGQKIWQVETNVLMMPLVGTLEPNYEIPLLMLASGLIGLPLSFAVMRRGAIQERRIKQSAFRGEIPHRLPAAGEIGQAHLRILA